MWKLINIVGVFRWVTHFVQSSKASLGTDMDLTKRRHLPLANSNDSDRFLEIIIHFSREINYFSAFFVIMEERYCLEIFNVGKIFLHKMLTIFPLSVIDGG